MTKDDFDIIIPKEEIIESFIHASGPGGQHVNKTATAVQLRFNIDRSTTLPGPVRERLKRIAGNRVNSDGDLIIVARRYRSQLSNRKDAYSRLHTLVKKAFRIPKKRIPTRRTAASNEKRLKNKQARSKKKVLRQPVEPD